MARTIAQIQQQIIDAKNADSNLSALSSTSAVAIWRLWTYIVAVAIWALEKLFDLFKADVNTLIASGKPHTLRWYALKAKLFQFGYSLFPDEDFYDNTGIDEATITAAQVVKYAAAVEVVKGVRIKVAGETAGDLAPLTTPQLDALKTYMGRIKDAGVKLYYTNSVADSLKLEYDIYYDPLILDATGQRLDGINNTPVQDAIDEYLKEDMTFNGLFLPVKLTDKLQAVEGVVIPHLVLAQSQYGLFPFLSVGVQYQPDAGYLRLANPSDLTLNFLPHEPI